MDKSIVKFAALRGKTQEFGVVGQIHDLANPITSAVEHSSRTKSVRYTLQVLFSRQMSRPRSSQCMWVFECQNTCDLRLRKPPLYYWPPNWPVLFCSLASVVYRRRARWRCGNRHCTAGQYGYVPLGRNLIIHSSCSTMDGGGWSCSQGHRAGVG